jgi:hypothetical protein
MSRWTEDSGPAQICAKASPRACSAILTEYMPGLNVGWVNPTFVSARIRTHRQSSSKSVHIEPVSDGEWRRIAANLRRIRIASIPRMVAFPRASRTLPETVPGPHTVEVSVEVRCESDTNDAPSERKVLSSVSAIDGSRGRGRISSGA